MTIRVPCPTCHGEGSVEHRVFAAGASPDDHDDLCDTCRGLRDSDGVCRIFESKWQQVVAHPRLNPCRRLRVVA